MEDISCKCNLPVPLIIKENILFQFEIQAYTAQKTDNDTGILTSPPIHIS